MVTFISIFCYTLNVTAYTVTVFAVFCSDMSFRATVASL